MSSKSPTARCFATAPDEASDGLSGQEGAFAICSFWLVSALMLAGRPVEAARRFAVLRKRASDLGLYAEELAADGSMLGNFRRRSPTSR
ncbi:MAG TPA: hypothetical protein VGV57_07700 [Thermoleophilaceae bacterium]|nr:hypothetical protein [Thermoleophilaceae bacterium]